MAKAGIVYVGTHNGLVIYSDPGGTGRWRRRDQTLEGQAVRALMAVDGLVLTAVTDSGALLSTDGGESWGQAEPNDAAALSALLAHDGPLVGTAQGLARWKSEHPPAPGAAASALLSGKQEVLLTAIAGGTSLLRSEDGGASWEPATLDQPLQGAITVIAPASYHMDIAWAGTSAGQLLRSDDRGRSWAQVGEVGAGILSLAVVRLI
jgi:photosystem II stability/assembly factor-like uncharacterized protein